MENIIALMSGGIDSFVMARILSENYEVFPLFIDYNQLAVINEKNALLKQIEFLQINELTEIKLSNIDLKNSLTVDNEYTNDFYPARNLLLLIIASQVSIAKNADRIAIGIIGGVRVFPDTTSFFIQRAEQIISDATNKNITIFTPLSEHHKVDILILAEELGLPLDLSYSCQKGRKTACNLCPSCKDLLKAKEFLKNQTID